MVKLSKKIKSILFVIILICSALIPIFVSIMFNIHIFQGDRSAATSLLSTLIQCLATIVTLIFTIILFLGQFSLGKYVTRTIDYVLLNWNNLSILAFYIGVIIYNVLILSNITIESWRLYVDVSVILSSYSMIILVPFFLSIPNSLKPQSILNAIQKEIINKKELELPYANRKLELLFSITGKSRDGDEFNDAIYGINAIGETIRAIDLKEKEYLFLNSAVSKLEHIALESLDMQLSLSITCINEFDLLLNFINKKTNFVIVNIGNQIATSSLAIVRASLDKVDDGLLDNRHCINIIVKTYNLILRQYEFLALKDFSGLDFVQQIISYISLTSLPTLYWLSPESQICITHLFKKNREKHALTLFNELFDKSPKDNGTLLFCLTVLFESKEYKEFFFKIVEKVRYCYGPLKVNIESKKEGVDRSLSISDENTIMIRIGNEEKEFALWVRENLE